MTLFGRIGSIMATLILAQIVAIGLLVLLQLTMPDILHELQLVSNRIEYWALNQNIGSEINNILFFLVDARTILLILMIIVARILIAILTTGMVRIVRGPKKKTIASKR